MELERRGTGSALCKTIRGRCPAAYNGSECVFARWSSAQGLSRSLTEEWFSQWKSRSYSSRNILFYQGNDPLGLYFICAGRIKLVSSESWGGRQILRVVSAPDLLGERALVGGVSTGAPYEASAEVLDEGTRVCFVEAGRFLEFMKREIDVSRLILRHLAKRLAETQYSLAEMGLLTIRQRLARLIFSRKEAVDGKGERAYIGESRRDLAEMLGTSPEVICRILADLEQSKIIQVDGRHVRIWNDARLRYAARLPNL